MCCVVWWSRLVSNQRPSACEADALPLSYETGRSTEQVERRRRLARKALSTRIRADTNASTRSGLWSRDGAASSRGGCRVDGGFVLAACSGGSTGTQSDNVRSTTGRTTTQPVAAPADLEVFHLSGFVSPSGNVSCMIDVDWARREILDRDWSPPARPADCEFDYGQGISLASGEQAQFVCAGDTAFGMDAVLPDGESIAAGVLRCETAESGITCRDLRTSHGFSISRQAYRQF